MKKVFTRKDEIVDDYHGTKVADPYRWLEDPNSLETQQWVEAQNAITTRYLSAIPARSKIAARLAELWNYPKYSVPQKEGHCYFFFKNAGLQNQSILYMQNALGSEPQVVIDPNTWSEEGTVSLSNAALSEDGSLLAYAVSSSGSDQQEIKIRQIDSAVDYPEVLQWCKFSSIAWRHDNSGFFYNRFPQPGTVPEEDQNNFNRVYWHALNTPQSEDELIYERPDAKELTFYPFITDDGTYLTLSVWHGSDQNNRFYYREVDSNQPFIRLLDEADAGYNFIGNTGSIFYFQTTQDAPRGRIIAIDTLHPERANWRELVSEQDDVIAFALMVNNQFVVTYMQDAHHCMKIFDLDGSYLREIELPGLGSILEISGKPQDTEMFISFTSFLHPPTIFRYDFMSNTLAPWHRPELNFDTAGYETKQVFYISKDGTRVPMFLTHKKGLQLNGNNPTLLYGYGGFDACMTPNFAVGTLV